MTSTSEPTRLSQRPVRRGAPREHASPDVVRELRRFHLGRPEEGGRRVEPDRLFWFPASLLAVTTERPPDYPLLLLPGETAHDAPAALPLGRFLIQTLGGSADAAAEFESRVASLLAGKEEPRPALSLFEKVLAAPEGDRFAAARETLLAALPSGSWLLGFSAAAPLHLLHHAALRRVLPARSQLVLEAEALAGKLREVLEADRAKHPEARGAEGLSRTMGEVGAKLLDPGALSGVLGSHRGGKALGDDRESRIRLAWEQLDRAAHSPVWPPLTIVHDGSLGELGTLTEWELLASEDPCQVAQEIFDEHAARLAEVLVAARVAKLELADAYDPTRHDPWLGRFGWDAFSREELLALPPVVALTTAEHLAQGGMASLSALLLSGRPVQVLVLDRPASNPGAGATASGEGALGFRLEPGYLGISHREAVVGQVTSVRSRHLLDVLGAAMHARRASLIVLSSARDLAGQTPAAGAAAYLEAALRTRAHPLFRYDPEAGSTWARRLDFSENAAPSESWVRAELTVRREEGGEDILSLVATFADFALLEPALARHFRLLPDGFPEEELVTVDVYIALDEEKALQKIPFVWAVDDEGRLERLAVTRALAQAARDRLGFWRTLQELAGVRNEYVEGATSRTREEMEVWARQEIEQIRAQHVEEVARVRETAAEDVVRRLTASLLEVDLAAVAAPGSAALVDTLRTGSLDDVARALLKAVGPHALDEETQA